MEIEQIGVLGVEIAGAEAPLVIWKLVLQNLILSASFYECSQKHDLYSYTANVPAKAKIDKNNNLEVSPIFRQAQIKSPGFCFKVYIPP